MMANWVIPRGFARLRALAARLRADRSGSSVIEFGLFAPILAVGVMGIADVSMGYSHKLTIEQAASRALEKVAVGSMQTDFSSLRAEAATAAGVPITAVTVDTWLECDRVRQAAFSGTCTAAQEMARYVGLSITSSYQPSFNYGPLAGGHADANGAVPITANSVLRIQ